LFALARYTYPSTYSRRPHRRPYYEYSVSRPNSASFPVFHCCVTTNPMFIDSVSERIRWTPLLKEIVQVKYGVIPDLPSANNDVETSANYLQALVIIVVH
jgi:hypothetical protein